MNKKEMYIYLHGPLNEEYKKKFGEGIPFLMLPDYDIPEIIEKVKQAITTGKPLKTIDVDDESLI